MNKLSNSMFESTMMGMLQLTGTSTGLSQTNYARLILHFSLIVTNLDERNAIEIVYLDISIAFSTVTHDILLNKIRISFDNISSTH